MSNFPVFSLPLNKYRFPEKYFGILNSEGQPQGIAHTLLANLIIWNSIGHMSFHYCITKDRTKLTLNTKSKGIFTVNL
ncbi:hypothetical protein MTBBW1_1260036 [Desulfamplus magnetovallimortis]|uniref:Uncharacterized protein n=1 Tax=Desulfamplus magnetovallimortis TaxID=1246637 RepID=A0A1W1H6P8_9BACT|nr:hypothetical protein MTBBW1_1260036 [Desulfamplus magnetovallimortis]